MSRTSPRQTLSEALWINWQVLDQKKFN